MWCRVARTLVEGVFACWSSTLFWVTKSIVGHFTLKTYQRTPLFLLRSRQKRNVERELILDIPVIHIAEHLQQVADGIGNPSLDWNPGSLRVIQSRYLEGLLPLRIIEGHKKSPLFSVIEGHLKRGVIQGQSIIQDHQNRNSVLNRILMTPNDSEWPWWPLGAFRGIVSFRVIIIDYLKYTEKWFFCIPYIYCILYNIYTVFCIYTQYTIYSIYCILYILLLWTK